MTWWGWMILGSVLFAAELFAIDAQFYLVFVGVSAAVVGLLGLAGVSMPEWAQWLTFAALSLISMFTFRKSLYEKLRQGAKGYSVTITGDFVNVTDDIAPGMDGRVDYRGTRWHAVNVGESTLTSGSRARVVEVDGTRLNLSGD